MDYSPSKAIFLGVIGMAYKDRGDPLVADFGDAELTIDGAWHTLDLSAIVAPAGANHLVHLYVLGVSPNAGSPIITFREKGNVNGINVTGLRALVANLPTLNGDAFVTMNASREIEYQLPPSSNNMSISVRGWVVD